MNGAPVIEGPWELIVSNADGSGGASARSFVAAVGRALTLDLERVEDLKLILTELTANGAEQGAADGTRIVLATEGASLVVRCEGTGAPSFDPTGLRRQLVDSLADNLAWSDDGSVTFTV
jgi:two-component sensor histidine kinase